MALYKNGDVLQFSRHANFDKTLAPTDIASDAGIYRCVVCGEEIGISKGSALPPGNHHKHAIGFPPIRWQLIVCAMGS